MNTQQTYALAWAVVGSILLIGLFTYLTLATPLYSIESTKQLEACVRGGMQWVEGSCLIGTF